jgi:hypothetical protein
LYSWLSLQRRRYKNGQLNDHEITSLQKLDIFLTPIDLRDLVWESKYQDLINFREEKPDRWPSFYSESKEKKLYEWCQAQRQVYAKTARRRKELSHERISKLNRIEFYWSLDELKDRKWEEIYLKLKIFMETQKTNSIPITIDGESNSLYTWLRNQRNAIKKGKLSSEKKEEILALGVII